MSKIIEWCSSCGTEQEISEFGGICKECGLFLKPCSQCDINKVECKCCPYDTFIPKTEEISINGNTYTIVEIDTIYNKYLQLITESLRDYETMKVEYTINEFIMDLQNNYLDYEIKVFNSLYDIVQYLYVDGISNNDIASIIVDIMNSSKKGAVSITDENNVIVFNENTEKEKYVLLEEKI